MVNRFGYDDSHLNEWEKLGVSQEQYWRLKNPSLTRLGRAILYLEMLMGEDHEDDEEEDDFFNDDEELDQD